jgi:hypothetical protein
MTRRRVAGIALAIAAIALAMTAGFVPRIGNLVVGATGIHDLGALPEHIGVCGRDWRRESLNRVLTLDATRARYGREPVLVDFGPLAGCPPGPCTGTAQNDPCDTVVFVRVGEDGYIELQGGP